MTVNAHLFNCDLCLFKELVCQYISGEEFDLLYQSSSQIKIKKGEFILRQNVQTTHIAYISSGIVKFNYEDDNGRNLILTIIKSPSLLGSINMLNEAQYIFSIIAVEDCDVCLIDISVLKNLILKNSQLGLHLIGFTSSMFKDSIFNFISLAHKQVNGRMADILIYLSKKVYCNNNFKLSLTRKELSEFAGCSQENVIHTLTKFHKEGIIKTEGKRIEILDFDRLNQISRIG